MRRQQELYRRVFVAAHGPLPHPCHFCQDPVTRWGKGSWEGGIHHIDGDHSHNDPVNLAAAHPYCHIRHHSTGRVMSVESSERKRLAATTKSPCPHCGKLYNPVWMTRHVSAGKCVGGTPEQREALSAAMAAKARQQWADGKAGTYERTPEVRTRISTSLTGRTQTAESRAKKSEAMKRAYAEGRKAKPPGRPKRTS